MQRRKSIVDRAKRLRNVRAQKADGDKTAMFNKFLQHFQAVGSQADNAQANLYKHRQEEKQAAVALKKIQAQEDKSAASSDTALLTITSVRLSGLSACMMSHDVSCTRRCIKRRTCTFARIAQLNGSEVGIPTCDACVGHWSDSGQVQWHVAPQ